MEGMQKCLLGNDMGPKLFQNKPLGYENFYLKK